MIKASELRVKNLVWSVYDKSEYYIKGSDIMCLDEDSDPHVFNAIPITEEWLLKLGFRIKHKYGNLNVLHSPCEMFYFELRDFSIKNYSGGRDIIKIKSVHQLQNLYYSLTGTELELNGS